MGELIPSINDGGKKAGAARGFTLLCAKVGPGVIDRYGALLEEEIDAIISQ